MNNTLPRMRTPHAAITELKSVDSETAFTERALRRLIMSGEIPSVRIGRKFLVNMSYLYDYLYSGGGHSVAEVKEHGIRKIAE